MEQSKDPKEVLKKWKNSQTIFDYSRELVEGDGLPTYPHQNVHEYKVQLRIDETISPGMFKPDPLIPGGFKANSLTIRAMRKDVFVLDSLMTELEEYMTCSSCSKNFDLQFWSLCPFCGKEP
jgi:hypothetical protein